MDKSHIKLDLSRLSVADQIAEARRVIPGILASDLADKVALADRLTAVADQLEADEATAQRKSLESQAAFATRNETEFDFADIMGDVAATVEKETDYNGPQMQNMGYALASTNRAIATMTKVLGLRLSPGDRPGQLHAQWKPMPGAKAYQVQYAVSETLPPDEANWQSGLPATASKTDINGLPARQLVWVRVSAVGSGSGNVGPWSDAVSMAAQ